MVDAEAQAPANEKPNPKLRWAAYAAAALLLLNNLRLFSERARYCLFDSTDTGWLIRTGEYIVRNGVLPKSDIFSWTMTGKPWVVYQWLAEVVMWLIYSQGGLWLVGLVWLTLVSLLYFWLLPRQFLRLGVPLAVAFALLALVLTPSWFFSRPQTFSFFFLLAFQAVLEFYRRTGKWKALIALPPLMILWANTHSFWFLGLLVLLCYCVVGGQERSVLAKAGRDGVPAGEEQSTPARAADARDQANVLFKRTGGESIDKTLIICLVVCALSLLCNPYGIGLVEYNISFIGDTQMNRIAEVGPMQFGRHNGYFIYVLLFIYGCARQFAILGWGRTILAAIILTAAIFVRRFEPIAIVTTWLYMGFLLEGLIKNLPAPTKLSAFSKLPREFASGAPTLRVDLMLLTCALVAGFKIWSLTCPDEAYANALFRGSRTDKTLAWYEKNRTGKERVFCDADTGDWLILHKAGPVFIDTRFDFYGNLFFNEWYDCVEGAPGWDKYLDRYGVTHVILRGLPGLARRLETDAGWEKVQDDEKIRIWARKSTQITK